MAASDPAWPQRQKDRMASAFASGRIVHLTHGDCLDGHSCAGLLLRAAPDALWIGLRPTETARALGWAAEALRQAKEAAPLPRRARLLATDLSIQPGELPAALEALRALAADADVLWLDHHEPQWPAEVEAEVRATGARTRVDRTGRECGATLLLDTLRGPDAASLGLPEAAAAFTLDDDIHMRSVANRDTWTDPDDRRGILLGLGSSRLRRDYVTLVRHGEYRAVLLLAEHPFRERRRELEEALRRIERRDDVSVVFGRAPLSDLAHRHWSDSPGARVLLHFTDDGLLRIRTRRDTPVAAELARRHGGGGHANAAGAPLLEGRRLRLRMYRALRGRDPAVRRVVEEARQLVAAASPPPRTGA